MFSILTAIQLEKEKCNDSSVIIIQSFLFCGIDKMGQILPSDPTRSMLLHLPESNVVQRVSFTPLLTLKWLQVPFYEKIFEYESLKKIEVTYKFFENTFIHLQINKEKQKQEAGCPLNICNEVVYGYKFKKQEKRDKIRPDKIFFRRKIFSNAFQPPKRDKMKTPLKNRTRSREHTAHPRTSVNHSTNKEEMLRKIAELKLLSKWEVGVKMARTIDGADGILTENYIEFYSEAAIERGDFEKREPAEKEKLEADLKKKGFRVKSQWMQMAYSVFQKGYITRPYKRAHNPGLQEAPKENRSIKFMVRACEEEINLIVCKLDGMTNMLSAIQNHLNYREIDKAMEKFQENMAEMEEHERLNYAEQMALMLSKYNYYQNYENQVTSYISTSRSSLAESRNLSASRFDRKNTSRQSSNESLDSANTFKTSRMSSEYDSRNPISPVTSPKSNLPLRYSQPDSPRRGTPEREHSVNETLHLRDSNSNTMLETAQERLKTAISENQKEMIKQALTCLRNLNMQSQLQTECLFGRLLLENGKPKYAKNIFERLLYTKRLGKQGFICSEIESMLAFYHYSKQNYQLSLAHYEKALGLRYRFKNYSRKTAILYNNLSVLSYLLENYQKSLLWLHRGFKLGEYCPDYELVMRSNYAMILAQKGQIKEAKMEMYKSHKNVEPYCNMEVLCKFHSNLGYLELLENVLDKAKTNFELACDIQTKYLLPNHYKPSVFLHNNMAIYHAKASSQHRKSEWKKAAAHLLKIESQLSQLKGMLAVQVHFNFGKVLKENYELDEAVGHFVECRTILLALKESLVKKYQDKIENEINMIESQRIVEQSEESSCMNKFSKLSRLSKRSKVSRREMESKIVT